jgi:hypothetical protein
MTGAREGIPLCIRSPFCYSVDGLKDTHAG